MKIIESFIRKRFYLFERGRKIVRKSMSRSWGEVEDWQREKQVPPPSREPNVP